MCGSADLRSILFVGYLPPVNTMPPIGTRPDEQPAYPAELLRCDTCTLVQLGLVVDPTILFPPHYAYTSGTTRILRDNFAELYREVTQLFPLRPEDLVVDIGSNDGTLLGNFIAAGTGLRRRADQRAQAGGGGREFPRSSRSSDRRAPKKSNASTAGRRSSPPPNVFAHIEDVHEIVDSVLSLLADDGVFITESHYLLPLVETLQYDTIYHEHLRYYSLDQPQVPAGDARPGGHPREADPHARRIDSRVCLAQGLRPVSDAVAPLLRAEESALTLDRLAEFRRKVSASKLDLLALLHQVRRDGSRVYAVGAPSRASTLVNYVGLDDSIVDCVLEIKGSYKIGKYMPGTLIPVLEEQKLFEDQPEYALLLSWHIGDELAAKLRELGFRGKFLCPLPSPRLL